MDTTNTSDVTTIELYVRCGKPAVWEYQAELIERAERLAEVGVLEGVRLRQCGSSVALSGDIAEAEHHRFVAEGRSVTIAEYLSYLEDESGVDREAVRSA